MENNFTYQRKVENETTMSASLLNATYKTYDCFVNNLDDALNNALNVLFGIKPISHVEKTPIFKQKHQQAGSLSDSKKPNANGTAKGWLVCTNGSFSFPKTLSKLPCCNFPLKVLNVTLVATVRTIIKSTLAGTSDQTKLLSANGSIKQKMWGLLIWFKNAIATLSSHLLVQLFHLIWCTMLHRWVMMQQ